jgi:RNA-dependent RNA polymerase
MPFFIWFNFQEESGEIAVQDGKDLIHTDGTGLISVDLARNCPSSIFKGNFLKVCDLLFLANASFSVNH